MLFIPSTFHSITATVRWRMWWHYKIGHVLAFCYLPVLLFQHLSFEIVLLRLGLFLPAAAGIAALGYLINDWYDRHADRAAKKPNILAAISNKKRVVVITAVLVAATTPWFGLPFLPLVYMLLGLQLLLYFAYSHPLLRLKEKAGWGLVADSLYGHVNPALVAFLVFAEGTAMGAATIGLLLLIILWQFFKGLRNIMAHQLDDRRRDRLAGISTFVLQFGALRALRWINYFFIPVELLFLSITLAYVSVYGHWWLMLVLLFFLALTVVKFSLWKSFVLHPRHFIGKFLFFLNDFYESYLPVLLLIGLAVGYWPYLMLLAAHLVLMPQTIRTFLNDWRTFKINLAEGISEMRSKER